MSGAHDESAATFRVVSTTSHALLSGMDSRIGMDDAVVAVGPAVSSEGKEGGNSPDFSGYDRSVAFFTLAAGTFGTRISFDDIKMHAVS